MTRIIAILLVALVVEAVGIVFLGAGLKEIKRPAALNASGIAQLLKSGATNRNLLVGVFLEAVFFAALLYLLSQRDVSFVWPLTSLGFIITTLAARFILHEQVHAIRWSGVLLIVLGACLVTWSEARKSPEPPDANSSPAPLKSIS
jgi:drug/metabolite transporter (DMT)-like permease